MKKNQLIILALLSIGTLIIIGAVFGRNQSSPFDPNTNGAKEPLTKEEITLLQNAQTVQFVLPESGEIITKPGDRNPNQWTVNVNGIIYTIATLQYDIAYARRTFSKASFKEVSHQGKRAWSAQTDEQLIYIIEKDYQTYIWVTAELPNTSDEERAAQTFRAFVNSVSI